MLRKVIKLIIYLPDCVACNNEAIYNNFSFNEKCVNMTVFLLFIRGLILIFFVQLDCYNLYFLYECQCYCGSFGYVGINNNQAIICCLAEAHATHSVLYGALHCMLVAWILGLKCQASVEESALQLPGDFRESPQPRLNQFQSFSL